MRVLQLIGSTGFYGAEAVVASLTKSLPDFGIETCIGHIRYARTGNVKLEDELPEYDVVPLEHQSRLDLAVPRELLREIRRRGIQLIHSHGYKPDLYCALIARAAGIPVISTCHLWTRSTAKLKLYAMLDGRVMRGFKAVVAVSEPIFEELKTARIPEKKLTFIPNGIDVSRFQSAPPLYRHMFPKGCFIFGVACRQVTAKGVDVLLRTIPRVAALRPNARFLIAGDGPLLEDYKQLARDLAIDDKVVFLGRCESMPEFYSSIDSFLLPSLDEGLPIALLEAMASGRMVIASDVGSVKAVVRDQENGLLIQPGNVEALTSAILSVTSNHDRLSRFGSAARGQVIAQFSSYRMASRYAELYRQVSGA